MLLLVQFHSTLLNTLQKKYFLGRSFCNNIFSFLLREQQSARLVFGELQNWILMISAWLPLQNSVVLSAAIFITLIGLLVYLHFVKIDQESLLIVGSLGIQMTSSYASGKESTTFIEMNQVKDVVINEAIYMVSVVCPFFLCYIIC